MKKYSISIYVTLGLFVALFILGSFVDLNLSQAIANKNNMFGLIISIIGTIPGYGCLAIIGGSFFFLGIQKFEKKDIWKKVIFLIMSVVGLGSGVYFSGKEFFGKNGFYWVTGEWVGFFIALPIMLALAYLGYRLASKSDNPRLWLVLAIFAAAVFIALVPGVTLLKSIFHRPRYRMISSVEMEGLGLVSFHSWWQRCPDYKEIISQYNAVYPNAPISSEEFKSFPSGHAGAACVFLLLPLALPLYNKKYDKLFVPMFIGGFVWLLLVCFVRILVGAHFLSDVSMGSILTLIFILVSYFLFYKSKFFQEYLAKEE